MFTVQLIEMKKSRWRIVIALAIHLCCCACESVERQVQNIEWQESIKLESPVDYLSIDSVGHGYFVSYSNRITRGGGAKIIRTKDMRSMDDLKVVYHTLNTFRQVLIQDSTIYVLEDRIDHSGVRTGLLISGDLGESWNQVDVPMQSVRRIMRTVNDVLVLEGDRSGSSHLCLSYDNGRTWNSVDMQSGGYKSVRLLRSAGEVILIEASKSFNYEDRFLLTLNVESRLVHELYELGTGDHYIQTMPVRLSLDAIISQSSVLFFDVVDSHFMETKEVSLPDGCTQVDAFYCMTKRWLICGRDMGRDGIRAIWISEDQGKLWEPCSSVGMSPVQSNFDDFWVIDSNNMLLLYTELSNS